MPYATSILQETRQGMTVCPPPQHTSAGCVVPYSKEYESHYDDLARQKLRCPVYVEERAEAGRGLMCPLHYIMLVRCLSCDADLDLILHAAEHLDLIRHWHVERGCTEGLDPTLESNYISVTYDAATVMQYSDGEQMTEVPIFVCATERQRIWKGLFEAAGYMVKWGNAVNVRRRSL